MYSIFKKKKQFSDSFLRKYLTISGLGLSADRGSKQKYFTTEALSTLRNTQALRICNLTG
jgi:hypothetical protein